MYQTNLWKGEEYMNQSFLIATLLTLVVFVTFENIRRDVLHRNMLWINDQVKEYTAAFLGDMKIFDVFLVKQLREKMEKDFIKKQGIDHFELMMLDSRRIKIGYELEGAWEEIEISTEFDRVELVVHTEFSY